MRGSSRRRYRTRGSRSAKLNRMAAPGFSFETTEPDLIWRTRESCSRHSSVCTAQGTLKEPASGWQLYAGSSAGTADPYGQKAPSIGAPRFILRLKTRKSARMRGNVILLVEDNARDEALTLRALEKSDVIDDVVIVRDGVE